MNLTAVERCRPRRGRTSSKLSPAQVARLRQLYTEGWSHRRLAARFGLSRGTVWSIVSGRYWRIDTEPVSLTERFWGWVRKTDDCWIWTGNSNRLGYGRFGLPDCNVLAHRFSWELHHGRNVPQGMLICHHCDNPPCVRPDHLFVGTMKDNIADARRKDRLARKHNDHTVRAVRALFAHGVSQAEIGRRFTLKRSTVCDMVHGRTHAGHDYAAARNAAQNENEAK